MTRRLLLTVEANLTVTSNQPRDRVGRYTTGLSGEARVAAATAYWQRNGDRKKAKQLAIKKADAEREASEKAKIASMGPLTAKNAVGLRVQNVDAAELAKLVNRGIEFRSDQSDTWDYRTDFLLTRTQKNDKHASPTQSTKDFPWRVSEIEVGPDSEIPQGHGLYKTAEDAILELQHDDHKLLRIASVEWTESHAKAVVEWLAQNSPTLYERVVLWVGG